MYVVRGEEDRESQLVKATSISHSVMSFPGNSGTQTLFFLSPLHLKWEYLKCGTGEVVPARAGDGVNPR